MGAFRGQSLPCQGTAAICTPQHSGSLGQHISGKRTVMHETTWALPAKLLDLSVDVMRPSGRMGNEGLALWLGKAEASRAVVTHLVSLRGAGFQPAPLQLRLSWNAMSRLTDLAD